MITALSISDFVLIDRLNLEAAAGFTGLTGQTGAGKSIILDALGMALGMRPDKRFVRAGAQKACVSVEFDVPAGHDVWAALEEAGLDVPRDEALVLKRVIPARGSARSYINERSVASSVLTEIGAYLIEINSQHSASNLLKPSYHRDLLDGFAGNGKLRAAYAKAWAVMLAARAVRVDLESRILRASDERDLLLHCVEELEALAPEVGESARLASERAQRMQAGRIVATVSDALTELERCEAETFLASTSAALDRLTALPGFGADGEGDLPGAVKLAAETFERASIETQEAIASLHALSRIAAGDDAALEQVEARLFNRICWVKNWPKRALSLS